MTTQPSSSLSPVQDSPLSLNDLKKTKDNQALVQWVKDQYEKAKNARAPFKSQWDLNYAFYKGRQYLQPVGPTVSTSGKFHTPKAPPHRVRTTVNKIRPTVLTEIAKSIQQKPSASVVPASSSDEDAAMASAAEQVWESISNTHHYDVSYVQAVFWRSICGTSFIKSWWDSAKGPSIPIATQDEMQDPFSPETSQDPQAALIKAMMQPQGDVSFQAITPYHLLVPDLRTVGIQEQPYLFQVFTMPVDKAKATYPQFNFTSNAYSSQEILEDAVLSLTGGQSEPDSVLCIEFWAKPNGCSLLPNGGMLQIVGDNLVYLSDQGIPYEHGEYPFSKLDMRPTGIFYSDSTIVDLIPLQREYNRTKSQIVEAKNRMAKPQLLYVKGSLDPRKITTEAGLAIEYKPGFNPPTPMPLQPLPNYVLEEIDRIQADWEDISGQHQVSRGEAPAGVTAATAISFLQEKDDGILATAFFSVEKCAESVAKQTLALCVQYWDISRAVKVVGADKAFDTLLLTGADLKDSTDIRMEGGSSLPTSKAAKQAFLMDMMKMGFIPPDEGLRLLEIGGVDKLYEKLKIDESQAQRENIKLKRANPEMLGQFQEDQKAAAEQALELQQQQMDQQVAEQGPEAMMDPTTGMPVEPPTMTPQESILPVNTYDNHEIHVMVHNNFRKSQEFELLPPEIKNEFEAHVNMHLAAINQAMMQVQQVQGMQQMQGGEDPNAQMGPSEPPPGPAESGGNQ